MGIGLNSMTAMSILSIYRYERRCALNDRLVEIGNCDLEECMEKPRTCMCTILIRRAHSRFSSDWREHLSVRRIASSGVRRGCTWRKTFLEILVSQNWQDSDKMRAVITSTGKMITDLPKAGERVPSSFFPTVPGDFMRRLVMQRKRMQMPPTCVLGRH